MRSPNLSVRTQRDPPTRSDSARPVGHPGTTRPHHPRPPRFARPWIVSCRQFARLGQRPGVSALRPRAHAYMRCARSWPRGRAGDVLESMRRKTPASRAPPARPRGSRQRLPPPRPRPALAFSRPSERSDLLMARIQSAMRVRSVGAGCSRPRSLPAWSCRRSVGTHRAQALVRRLSIVHSPPTSRRMTFPQLGQRRWVASRTGSPGSTDRGFDARPTVRTGVVIAVLLWGAHVLKRNSGLKAAIRVESRSVSRSSLTPAEQDLLINDLNYMILLLFNR